MSEIVKILAVLLLRQYSFTTSSVQTYATQQMPLQTIQNQAFYPVSINSIPMDPSQTQIVTTIAPKQHSHANRKKRRRRSAQSGSYSFSSDSRDYKEMEKVNRAFDKFNDDTHFQKMKFSDLKGDFNSGIDFVDFDKGWESKDFDGFLDEVWVPGEHKDLNRVSRQVNAVVDAQNKKMKE